MIIINFIINFMQILIITIPIINIIVTLIIITVISTNISIIIMIISEQNNIFIEFDSDPLLKSFHSRYI